ncbi:alpha-amylase family glycosyl hydrolase [Humisphaera borealis]|uniref:Glycosyl hydrolase family 13 catalytic domain-containing protein n=1 Tax=Humisphaera borealis TaxID=2807512 RepID=A0A7M2WUT1_9BACT|nr:alpha-amylase family glycosyl hydrolase [Humisphaera borealis]QOV89199.1 hypothetical protein IPV69_23785 [Humisphaera borealis]
MPVARRPAPPLPACPRVKTLAKEVRRSYPTGRQQYSRAFVGSPFEVSIHASDKLPQGIRAVLVTSLNARGANDCVEVPMELVNDKTLFCRITPDRPGLFWFHAQASMDGGMTWIHDPIPDAWVLVDPPQVDHMRLYTLIPSVSGSIADWAADLKRIRDMGFNTVHLLPLTVLDTSQSPYSARELFDIDPMYGAADSYQSGLAQLENFVEVAKALGMRLCFDLVLNHVGVDSNIVKRAPEWIVPDQSSPDGLRRARYWCDKGWLSWDDLVLIDYEHPSRQIRADIWRYMTEYALFWANYASQTDGFIRFDNLHSSDKRFVDSVTESLRATYPNVGVIAEYFTDSSTLLSTIPQWNLNLILATPWDSKFVPQLREYIKYIHSVSEHVRFFMPVTSHDSGSPAQEFGSVQSTVPRYVAAALLGTGATGITQGVEWGIERKIEFIGKQPRVVPAECPQFAGFLRRVNDILVAEPAFRRGENCQFVDNNHHALMAAFRKDGRPGLPGLLVICNFDIGGEHAFEADLSPFLGETGPFNCVDLITGQERSFASSRISLTMAPCAACVLKF